MREFSDFHPITLFAYFVSVLGIAMSILQPIMVTLLLIISTLFYYQVHHSIAKQLKFLVISFLLISLSNPLFVHQGISILFYFRGNPITLEAIVYGAAFGATLCGIWNLCSGFQVIMSSEKWMYLFGRAVPSLALVISMSLRLITKLKKQSAEIINAQKLLGNDLHHGTYKQRAHCLIQIFSMLITWAFETSVESADSMKARGYGTNYRTSFHTYHFTKKDGCFLGLILLVSALCFYAYQVDFSRFYYYPHIREISVSFPALLAYVSYGGYLLFPILYERKEEKKWNSFVSNI